MNEINSHLDALIKTFESPSVTQPKALKATKSALSAIKKSESKIHHEINSRTKRLDNNTRYKSLVEDLPKHRVLLESAIVRHLFHIGCEDVAEKLLDESPLLAPDTDSMMLYRSLREILSDIDEGNLQSAFQWAEEHETFLRRMGSPLEFELRCCQFLEISRRDRLEALQYLRNCSSFHRNPKAQQLGLSLIYPGREETVTIEKVKKTFEWAYLCNMNTSPVSQLEISCQAGAIALPYLAKSYSLMKTRNAEWTSYEELPVEVDLPEELHFHPIFVCPVSKDQTTPENPPCVMPCGHVVSRLTVGSLRTTSVNKRIFKCPYCPENTSLETIEQAIFVP